MEENGIPFDPRALAGELDHDDDDEDDDDSDDDEGLGEHHFMEIENEGEEGEEHEEHHHRNLFHVQEVEEDEDDEEDDGGDEDQVMANTTPVMRRHVYEDDAHMENTSASDDEADDV